ncbi:hypothetical protein [Chryseobacterium gambrini]|uniref:hypothetical protein n=1 Tax=Chryseobacterium gambrini TaxID=373672 RepID=UPI003D115475
MICTPLQTADVKCEGLTHDTPKRFDSGQSGLSGKTSIHHKFKSGKKPQGKFTSLKR